MNLVFHIRNHILIYLKYHQSFVLKWKKVYGHQYINSSITTKDLISKALGFKPQYYVVSVQKIIEMRLGDLNIKIALILLFLYNQKRRYSLMQINNKSRMSWNLIYFYVFKRRTITWWKNVNTLRGIFLCGILNLDW